MSENELEILKVSDIKRDPNNPRLYFPPEELNKLAESIDKAGVLVPVVVYKFRKKYRLLDGERRWTCCQTLGMNGIPAIVIDKPKEEERLTWMFNIHQVRERWQDMPTAMALSKLITETKITDDKELSKITGLSPKLVRQYRYIVNLPADMQDAISNQDIGMNFFWELKQVLDLLKSKRPNIWNDYQPDELLNKFVDKRKNNVITDTVSLRGASYMIRKAADDDPENSKEGQLDEMIRTLIDEDSMSVTEAYEETVMVAVELDKLYSRSMSVVKAFTRLLSKSSDDAERGQIREIGKQVIDQLNAALPKK